jgi:hypothetical protein
MKIEIAGGKVTENLGVGIPAPEYKKKLSSFSFHFQILHANLGIFDFNHFSIYCSVI